MSDKATNTNTKLKNQNIVDNKNLNTIANNIINRN